MYKEKINESIDQIKLMATVKAHFCTVSEVCTVLEG